MQKLDYWIRNPDLKLYKDLEWNIPEQKSGTLNIVGGNSSSFSTVVHTAEFLSKTFPIKKLNILLPASLKSKVPPLPDITFLPATESGSIDKSPLLNDFLDSADFTMIVGDVSKNSATSVALSDAIKSTTRPVLLTRDAIDSVTPEMTNLIERENLYLIGSLAQIQNVFRAVYYPKMILLSQPLMPIVEALHKFTLSYPVTILTFHQDQIIVASSGKVVTTPLEKTPYTPISLWDGQLASKISAMNLFTPSKPLEASVSALTVKLPRDS